MAAMIAVSLALASDTASISGAFALTSPHTYLSPRSPRLSSVLRRSAIMAADISGGM